MWIVFENVIKTIDLQLSFWKWEKIFKEDLIRDAAGRHGSGRVG